jgi:hypothetical protein
MGYLKYTVHIGTNVPEEPDVCIVCIKYRGRGFIGQLGTHQLGTHPLALHDGNMRQENLRAQDVNDTTILKRILNKWVKVLLYSCGSIYGPGEEFFAHGHETSDSKKSLTTFCDQLNGC